MLTRPKLIDPFQIVRIGGIKGVAEAHRSSRRGPDNPVARIIRLRVPGSDTLLLGQAGYGMHTSHVHSGYWSDDSRHRGAQARPTRPSRQHGSPVRTARPGSPPPEAVTNALQGTADPHTVEVTLAVAGERRRVEVLDRHLLAAMRRASSRARGRARPRSGADDRARRRRRLRADGGRGRASGCASTAAPRFAAMRLGRGLGELLAARADVGRRVPAGQRRDLHDVAGVRRVDQLVPADVDPDVAEAVEEDEVAGLQELAVTGLTIEYCIAALCGSETPTCA